MSYYSKAIGWLAKALMLNTLTDGHMERVNSSVCESSDPMHCTTKPYKSLFSTVSPPVFLLQIAGWFHSTPSTGSLGAQRCVIADVAQRHWKVCTHAQWLKVDILIEYRIQNFHCLKNLNHIDLQLSFKIVNTSNNLNASSLGLSHYFLM